MILVGSAVAALAFVAGCTTGPSAKSSPSSSQATSSSSASTSSPALTGDSSSTPAPSSSASVDSPKTDEDSARQAVEAAWMKFWNVGTHLAATSPAQVGADIAAVAVDPTKSQMLTQFNLFRSLKQSQYGEVVTHPYWTHSIGNSSTAVMGDCIDSSHSGVLSATGKKLTVGQPRQNTRATFVRDARGTWRVELVEYLLDVKC